MSASARHSRAITQHRSRARVWLCRLRSALIALVAAALLAGAGLQTPWAKQRLVTWLNGVLSTSEQTVRVEGLTGWLPQQARLASLTLTDRQGLWLQVQDIQLDWSPLQWFRGQLHITKIAAERCHILRMPEGTEPPPARGLTRPMTLPDVTVLGMHLGQLELSPSVAGRRMQFAMDGAAEALSNLTRVRADLQLTGDLALKASMEMQDRQISLTLEADQGKAQAACAYAFQDGRLDLTDIEATIPGVQLRGNASILLGTGLIDGTAVTKITDAGSFAALFGQQAKGRMTVKTTLKPTGQRQDLRVESHATDVAWSDLTAASLQVSADLTDLRKHRKGQATLSGRDLHWQQHRLSHVSLDARGDLTQGTVDVNTAGVSGQPFSLKHQAIWQREGGDWQVTLKDMQATYDQVRFCVKPQGALALQQRGTSPVTVGMQACELSVGQRSFPLAGTLTAGLSEARLQGDLQLQGNLATQVALDITLPIRRPGGQVQLALVRRNERVQCRAAYALNASQLTVTDLVVNAEGMDLIGQAKVQWERVLASGSLQAKVTDAAPLGRFIGVPVQGRGHGLVTFDADQGDQLLDWQWLISDINCPALQLTALEGHGSLRRHEGQIAGKASGTGQGITWGQLTLDQAHLEVTGDDQAVAVTLLSQGSLGHPFESQAHGILSLDRTAPLFLLDQAQVQVGPQAFMLRDQAILWRDLHSDPPVYSLQDCLWEADNATLSVEGSVSSEHLNLKAALVNLDIERWAETPGLTGTLEGRLTLSGTPGQPCLESDSYIRGQGLRQGDSATVTHVDAEVTTRLTGQDLTAEATLSTERGDRVAFQAAVPVLFSLAPWQWTMQDQTLQARFRADADVAMLDWLPPLREAVLQGRLRADVGYSGSFADGTLSGSAQWDNGYYEDIILGTVIPNIQATLTAENRQISLSARTSETQGTPQVTAQGEIKLSKRQDFPYVIHVEAERFPWIQRSDVSAVASGDITLTGSMKQVSLQGTLTADSGLLDLNARPSQAPPLITPPYPTRTRSSRAVTPSSGPGFVTEGGLSFDLGQAFQVMGPDLASLWNGSISLSRSNKDWILTGNVTPQRGDFRILGRSFRLSQGSIRLDGTSPVDPILDLTAVHQRRGIEARIRITGRASNPIVSIQSEPPLPEDAILATVLFGKDLSSITAMQAVQLAGALKNLHSPGGGIDLFRSTRQVLAIDYIDIQAPDEPSDSLSLTVGKQFHPQIYVELQRPLNQEGITSTHVEYEIRPNLSIETDAGPGIRPGLGLNWKKDY